MSVFLFLVCWCTWGLLTKYIVTCTEIKRINKEYKNNEIKVEFIKNDKIKINENIYA